MEVTDKEFQHYISREQECGRQFNNDTGCLKATLELAWVVLGAYLPLVIFS